MRPPALPEGTAFAAELGLMLGVVGGMLLVAALVTARRPGSPLPAAEEFLDRWQRLHGGYDPRGNRALLAWLRGVARLARPFARLGVHPHALTAATVWAAALAVVPAAAGGGWPVLAAGLIVLSGVADALDGTVAALTGRASRWGYVVDSLTDRASDLLFLGAVVVVGGWAWAAVAAGGAQLLHDYARARAAGAGAGEVIVVTLGERANRIIVLALTVALAGLWPPVADVIATAGLAVTLLLSVAGLAQLLVAVRRRLVDVDPTVQAGS